MAFLGAIGSTYYGLRPYASLDAQFGPLLIYSNRFNLYPEDSSLLPRASRTNAVDRGVFPVAFVHDGIPQRGLASSGKFEVDGASAPPSLVIRAPFTFIKLRIPVLVGTRTLSVKVRQVKPSSPRPKMVLRADGTVVATPQSATAAAGSGWVPISISFTALVDGAVDVELWNTTFAADTETFFDDLKVM